MSKIATPDRFIEAKTFRLSAGTAIGAEEKIHQRRDVRIVAGVAVTIMVPVMKFWRAEQHAQRSDRKPDIGMDVDGPDTAECDQSRDRLQRKTEYECGKIDDSNGVNRVYRMFAVSGEPVQMLGAVMDGVKTPEKANRVLQAVAPVNKKITEQHDFESLDPPRLSRYSGSKVRGNNAVEPAGELGQQPEDEAAPEQILAQKEA